MHESDVSKPGAFLYPIHLTSPPQVNRIALVNPQLSAQVESILVRMAQSGQLRGRVSEQQLIGLLDQADGQQSAATAKKGAIVVS
jgi:DNA-binding TFAR19-related protein (PDSD5 family)